MKSDNDYFFSKLTYDNTKYLLLKPFLIKFLKLEEICSNIYLDFRFSSPLKQNIVT